MLTLYDTQRSGNAWKVRLLAGFLGTPLQRVTLSMARGDLRADAFRRIAPLGQVPVLQLDDGSHLCESMAILFRLAQGSSWWPQEIDAQARVLSWLSFEQDLHMRPLAALRLLFGLKTLHTATAQDVPRWQAEAAAALAILERQLATSADGWVVPGRHPSIADVALYPYTRMAPMGNLALAHYPAIEQWLARFESLSGYQWLFPGIPDSNFHIAESLQEHR